MLDALAAGAPVEPLARYFEYWLLRLQGVYPEARGIAVGRGDGVSRGVAHACRRIASASVPVDRAACCGSSRACIAR